MHHAFTCNTNIPIRLLLQLMKMNFPLLFQFTCGCGRHSDALSTHNKKVRSLTPTQHLPVWYMFSLFLRGFSLGTAASSYSLKYTHVWLINNSELSVVAFACLDCCNRWIFPPFFSRSSPKLRPCSTRYVPSLQLFSNFCIIIFFNTAFLVALREKRVTGNAAADHMEIWDMGAQQGVVGGESGPARVQWRRGNFGMSCRS